MIILSWNVRGLNSIPRQKAIQNLVVDHNPDVLCIQETKLSVESMVQYASSIWSRGQC
ncbi:endonuclease/exonuclease/phosphatase family protein [Pseudomonas laurentiana]|uniref:endonuclease/exonuclease/phosphatase family protein n=1 Tax=Pseudomonas laurentiana TaxID=2364649 RepID=UPI0034D42B3C